MAEIIIPYKPREQQLKLHEALDESRFAVCVAHRRFGKTVAAVNQLIKSAISCERDRPRFAYIAPTYSQAKAIAWDYVKHFTAPLEPNVNETELRVDFWGRQIRLYGADNPDSLRGIYLDGAVLDEPAQMRANVFSQVLRPALADRKGWALFIGTPAGKNQFYDIAKQSKALPDWAFLEFKASQTGIMPADELAAARGVMTPEEYEQEFECSFEAAVRGAIYAGELAKARQDGRITSVPYERSALVNTYWDLGVGDSTSIWFEQRIGREVRLIDYYEASGEGLDHYVSILKAKGYNYGRHVAPHDIEVRELGSGRSRLETAANLGIRFDIAPKLSLEDGINAGRMFMSQCWFDAVKCDAGLEALMHYRRDFNDKMNEFKATPVHDWSSHAADAYRYLALSSQPTHKPVKIDYSRVGGVV